MAYSVGDPAQSDLTARARIRDAALRLFAERGGDFNDPPPTGRSLSAGAVRVLLGDHMPA